MRRYLLVALWPAGMAAIAAATAVAVRRASLHDAQAVPRDVPARRPEPVGSAQRADIDGTGPASTDGREGGSARDAGAIPEAFGRSPSSVARTDVLPDLVRLGAISCAGGAVAYGVMALLGPTVVNHGPAIDEPIVRWTTTHQVRPWAAVVERLDKVGHTWTTWGAAGTAAVCLGMSWRTQRWLPPTALGAAVLVDKYVTLALRRTFGRPGPPGSPGGTYPSGGCDRVVLFSGMIAHMLWREFSGSRRGRAWATGAVAALAFNQAYSRQYLSKHWFTDIISGTAYGAVLLVPFVVAVESIAGPVRPTARDADTAAAGAAGPGSVTAMTAHKRRSRVSPHLEGLVRWLRVS